MPTKRSLAAKKSARTRKLKVAGKKAAKTRKRSAAAKKAVATEKPKTAAPETQPTMAKVEEIENMLRTAKIVKVEPVNWPETKEENQ